MDRTERALFALVLATAAGPAAASDFRGFFSMFMATPFLIFAGLVSGFILLRRHTAPRNAMARHAPFLLLVPAWAQLAFLCVFMQQLVWVGIPVVTLLFVLAARRIWRESRGGLALWIPRVLLVLSVVVAGLMAWDMSIVVGYRGSDYALGMIVLLATLWGVCTGLCLFAARGRIQRHDASRSP